MTLRWPKSSDRADEWKYALAISVGLHLLLLLVLTAVRVSYEFSPPEFVEISFVTGQLQRAAPMPATTQEPSTTNEPAAAAERSARGAEAISLPKRRMLEEEEPVLRASDAGKLTPVESPEVILPEQVVERTAKAAVDRKLLEERGGKVVPDLSRDVGVSGGRLEAAPSRGTRAGEPFVITGEAARRTILYKVIPEYPEGLNKEAVVRIRFSVLPSGLVGTAVLVTKGGDATLERLTLDAFKQWRFNPLPSDVPQVEQEGVITFRWILR